MNSEKEKHSTYFSGNRFYILHEFNSLLRDGLVIPLTNKIYELASQKNATIDIFIASRGGDATLCMHIIALLELAKSKGIVVRTVVTDKANSAGSLVAIAGTRGERYIATTAEHCVHYGSHDGWTESTPLQTERNSDYKKRWFKKVKSQYQKYCEIPDLDEQLKDDSFFIPAKDCIKWGLADKYFEEFE